MRLFLLLLLGLLGTSCDKKYTGSPDFSRSALLQIHQSPLHLESDEILPENFIENEISIIMSETVLRSAVQIAALAKIWECSEEEALGKLSKRITVASQSGTDLIKITATGFRDKEAIDLLDAVTNSYHRYHKESWMDRLTKTLAALEDEIARHGDVVQERRRALTVLVQQYGIPYFPNQEQTNIGADKLRSLSALELRLSEALLAPKADEKKIEHLRKRYREWQEQVIDLSMQQHHYTQAVTEYEESYRLFIEMRRKQQQLRITSRIPRTFLTLHKLPQEN